MRKLLLTATAAAFALVGCGTTATTFVHSETTTLGRVVVYRNGVAYFERYATLEDDTLRLAVPADKVDDFLKSLTVVDAQTGNPAPISYPTDVFRQGTSLIEMKVTLPGPRPHRVKLSYVTEAPSWKPSYRFVVAKNGKVEIEAWAVVDNTSGEDWKDVKLGVGSSSALSFRFDLRSIRLVQRETLHSNDLFAQAPPMGGATYGGGPNGLPARQVLTELTDDVIAMNEGRDERAPSPPPAVAAHDSSRHVAVTGGSYHGGGGNRGSYPAPSATAMPTTASPPQEAQAGGGLAGMANLLKSSNQQIVIEGYANAADKDKHAASLDRANRVREQLVRNGVDPNKVVALGRGDVAGRAGGVRIVQEPIVEGEKKNAKTEDGKEPAAAVTQEPIGTSHFESTTPTSVARGTSAMVSILRQGTDGEIVYYFDPESARGNTQFPFKAVRIKNPTDSALESGPVTVFGEGRFIGEGLSEPIPAHATAFIPFALDRQIVVETKEAERDDIEKIITVQRGVFSTQVQHTRKSTVVLHNRLGEKATVYVRHTVAAGYKATKDMHPVEKIAGADLYKIELDPLGKAEVVIEERTPLFKTADIRTQIGMDLVRVYLSSAAIDGHLRQQVTELLKLQEDLGNYEQRIQTVRDQMGEYRQRMDELHAQILTLKLVKTGGELMRDLEKKMQEMGDKLSKATIDIVALQEKSMIARIHFQDGVADLSLEKKADSKEVAHQ